MIGQFLNRAHVNKLFRNFVRDSLSFGHPYQVSRPVFCNFSLAPYIEHNCMRADAQTQKEVIVSVKANMIELEGAVCAQ